MLFQYNGPSFELSFWSWYSWENISLNSEELPEFGVVTARSDIYTELYLPKTYLCFVCCADKWKSEGSKVWELSKKKEVRLVVPVSLFFICSLGDVVLVLFNEMMCICPAEMSLNKGQCKLEGCTY